MARLHVVCKLFALTLRVHMQLKWAVYYSMVTIIASTDVTSLRLFTSR